MSDIKTVDDLIKSKNLTREELEQFKDLIEEFRETEKKIKAYCNATEYNLKSFAQSMQVLADRTVNLARALQKLLEEADTLSLAYAQ